MYEIIRGDCVTAMRAMPDNSVDSIVCDPPYELTNGGKTGFMGKAWDGSGIAFSVEMWAEALRVLKPGGHLLAFGGSRTYHRMACAIEDAGFEIRDCLYWHYGSGFPKSLNVSKALDKEAGAVRVGTGETVRAGCRAARGGAELVGSESIEAAKWKEITEPATDAARQWEGWGTALKPSTEPVVMAQKPLLDQSVTTEHICMARKPLAKGMTVAANVLQFGTGGLNIDGCRVATDDNLNGGAYAAEGSRGELDGDNRVGAAQGMFQAGKTVGAEFVQPAGRWPANLIHSGDPEVLALFPESNGSGAARTLKRGARDGENWGMADEPGELRDAGSGSAARFFYCAKASKSDRGPGNTHATVKPLALMRYLLRLVTPPGGHTLDPFLGSGTTIVAALQEGFRATGIELIDEHADIAERRAEIELCGGLI